MLKTYFVGPFLTSTHKRLPPVPLKLQSYGALQKCLLLLFIIILWHCHI